MSYIFSRALVEEYLEASCSDSAPFAPSNSNLIPQAYCSPDRMTAYSRLSRFGMTYAPLTDDRGAALLTWYLEDFLARTFQPQEKAPALTAPAPASGEKCTELSMKYDRNSHSWKTHLCLWDEDLPESSVILPKSGYDAEWLVLGADDVGAPHVRKRIWILGMDRNADCIREEAEREVSGGQQAAKSIRVCGDVPKPPCLGSQETWPKQQATGIVRICPDVPDSNLTGLEGQRFQPGQSEVPEFGNYSQQISYPKNKRHVRGDREFSATEIPGNSRHHQQRGTQANDCGEWWSAEPDVGRVAHGVAARVDRLKAIGNGQVPAVAATAFRVLLGRFQEGKEGE